MVLIGNEPDRPYERPPLSKDYLRGEAEREAAYVDPAEFYEEKDIELGSRYAPGSTSRKPTAH